LSDHVATIWEAKVELQEHMVLEFNSEIGASCLSSILRSPQDYSERQGDWTVVNGLPSAVNGTKLSVQEFRDALLLCYLRSLGDLQSHCDGYGQHFSIRHALSWCMKGADS
jgi:hypothetical protein